MYSIYIYIVACLLLVKFVGDLEGMSYDLDIFDGPDLFQNCLFSCFSYVNFPGFFFPLFVSSVHQKFRNKTLILLLSFHHKVLE